MAVKVKVERHSVGPHGIQAITWSLRYWRAIHGELLTHRDFARNASSSRAVPVMKMLRQVWSEPAGPIHWGANRPGMQATEQLTGWRLAAVKMLWRWSARSSVIFSWAMMKLGLHKQVANRVTEPYQYITVLVTTTQTDNFYGLRRHKDAQPEMQELANGMYDAHMASKPTLLRPGQWHMPFVTDWEINVFGIRDALKMSTARAARVSTLNHDGTVPIPAKDFDLHDRLVGAQPIHASPSEHQLQCMETGERYANFRGFRPYRMSVESRQLIVNGRMIPLDIGTR